MKKIILILSIMISLTAYADIFNYPVKLETISSKIPQMDSIKCKFRQEKHLSNIKKPLVSGGNFEFIKGKGVYFNTTYPINSSVNYTNENYKRINDIISAVTAKKYSKLEKEFSFYFSEEGSTWTLGMKPKNNSDAINYISSVVLTGSDYIQKININQTNGNKTIIWFEK